MRESGCERCTRFFFANHLTRAAEPLLCSIATKFSKRNDAENLQIKTFNVLPIDF